MIKLIKEKFTPSRLDGHNETRLVYQWATMPVVEKMQLKQFIVSEKTTASVDVNSYATGGNGGV